MTGPAAVARGLGGRFEGRFSYRELNPEGSGPFVRYAVIRVSDGRYLGQVRRQKGTWAWTCGAVGEPGWRPKRHRRREWAADEIDATSMKHEWCACGVSVAGHDRPTRAAARAWAAASDPNRDVGEERDNAALLAARRAVVRGLGQGFEDALAHARQFAGPVSVGHSVLVVPDQAPVHRVLVRPDGFSCGIEVRHWIGEQAGEVYVWPNQDRSVEYIRGVYEARGYRPVYDWRK